MDSKIIDLTFLSLWVIHKETLYLSSGDINRVMKMMMIYHLVTYFDIHKCEWRYFIISLLITLLLGEQTIIPPRGPSAG
jgi:hypothetical protein